MENSYFFLMANGTGFSASGVNVYDAFQKSGKGNWEDVTDWDFEDMQETQVA